MTYMGKEYPDFLLDVDEQGIATLTVNRPEKMNALNNECWVEILDFFTAVDSDPDINLIIVTGAGEKAFVAGADINALVEKKPVDCIRNNGQKALTQVENCSKPVSAAVNGYAFGGGCELAIACDFRVVSENAIFALPEVGLGILPGAGGTQRLSRLIGLGRAKEIILAGKKVKAEEAVQIGLASSCVPQAELMAKAKKLASRVLANGPVGVRLAKLVVQNSLSASQDVGMLVEKLALGLLCGTEDKKEGTSAFIEKRRPKFKGE